MDCIVINIIFNQDPIVGKQQTHDRLMEHPREEMDGDIQAGNDMCLLYQPGNLQEDIPGAGTRM